MSDVRQLQQILYVDDEADIREVAQLALELIGGYTVRIYETGEEALVGLVDFTPDLILLDVMMPRMDGPQTFEALRKRPHLSNVPVVFFTAKAQANELADLMALGAAAVLAKPFDPMTLAHTLKGIWNRHHGRTD